MTFEYIQSPKKWHVRGLVKFAHAVAGPAWVVLITFCKPFFRALYERRAVAANKGRKEWAGSGCSEADVPSPTRRHPFRARCAARNTVGGLHFYRPLWAFYG